MSSSLSIAFPRRRLRLRPHLHPHPSAQIVRDIFTAKAEVIISFIVEGGQLTWPAQHQRVRMDADMQELRQSISSKLDEFFKTDIPAAYRRAVERANCDVTLRTILDFHDDRDEAVNHESNTETCRIVRVRDLYTDYATLFTITAPAMLPVIVKVNAVEKTKVDRAQYALFPESSLSPVAQYVRLGTIFNVQPRGERPILARLQRGADAIEFFQAEAQSIDGLCIGTVHEALELDAFPSDAILEPRYRGLSIPELKQEALQDIRAGNIDRNRLPSIPPLSYLPFGPGTGGLHVKEGALYPCKLVVRIVPRLHGLTWPPWVVFDNAHITIDNPHTSPAEIRADIVGHLEDMRDEYAEDWHGHELWKPHAAGKWAIDLWCLPQGRPAGSTMHQWYAGTLVPWFNALLAARGERTLYLEAHLGWKNEGEA